MELDGTGKLAAAQKPSYTAADVGALATSLKGASNGLAELGSDGKVPASQLPATGGATGFTGITSFVRPAASAFSEAVNSPGALTEYTDSLVLGALLTDSNENLRGVFKPFSAGGITVCLEYDMPASDHLHVGIAIRESGSGKIESLVVGRSITDRVVVTQHVIPTIKAGEIGGRDWPVTGRVWFRIYESGSTVYYQIGSNGREWFTVATQASGAYVNADQAGVVGLCKASGSSGYTFPVRLLHWSES